MKIYSFILAALLLMMGSSCQKEAISDLPQDNDLLTRAGYYSISGPTSIANKGSAVYSVGCPSDYSAEWMCEAGLNLQPDSRSIEVVAYNLEGWITLTVEVFDNIGRLSGTGSLNIYIEGSNGGPAVPAPNGNTDGTGETEPSDIQP